MLMLLVGDSNYMDTESLTNWNVDVVGGWLIEMLML